MFRFRRPRQPRLVQKTRVETLVSLKTAVGAYQASTLPALYRLRLRTCIRCGSNSVHERQTLRQQGYRLQQLLVTLARKASLKDRDSVLIATEQLEGVLRQIDQDDVPALTNNLGQHGSVSTCNCEGPLPKESELLESMGLGVSSEDE